MAAFYKPWTEVTRKKYDGLIITGAPIERLPFEDVAYWPELVDIFNWAASNVTSMLALCWGAQALLYHLYGLPRRNTRASCRGFMNIAVWPSDTRLFPLR